MASSSTEKSRARYRLRQENGLCGRCGRKLDNDLKTCSRCLEMYRARWHDPEKMEREKERVRHNHAERRRRFSEQNLCQICGKEPPKDGHSKCEECLVRYRQYRTAQRTRQKEQGVCQYCGARPRVEGRTWCERCREKRNARTRKVRLVRRDTPVNPDESDDDGLPWCTACDDDYSYDDSGLCERCKGD